MPPPSLSDAVEVVRVHSRLMWMLAAFCREHRERQAEYAMQLRVEETQREQVYKSRAQEQNTIITAELERRNREKERHERFVQKVRPRQELLSRCPLQAAPAPGPSLPPPGVNARLNAHLGLFPFQLQVRAESDELRELQAKLNAAETSFERKLQLQERALIASREAEYNAAIDARLTQERAEAEAAEQAAEMARRVQAIQGRLVLEQQMGEKLELQAQAQEAMWLERAQLEALAAQIALEDEAARADRKRKKEATRDYVRAFLVEREDLRQRQRELEEEEDRKIAAYRAAVEARTAGIAAKKKAKADEEARIFARLAAEAAEARAKREAMDELISRLHFEEEEEKRRRQAEEKKRKAEQAKAEMIAANQAQQAVKAARLERERFEEEAFRAFMLEKFAEDDRVEQMNAQRRRMRMLEHKKEVERLAAIKRAMFEEQRVQEQRELAGERAREAQVAAIVEQERLRMLREHATRLVEFLPKGVLVRPEDLDVIRKASEAANARKLAGR